ncbi:alpha/beta fold hydrolase [Methylococcus sp. Mc7]|uniref:alpha/beta fold hydrolase n=1 Tax=Methylococcus sp. Mc7 TaxID=2860258 RepID=UPI001C52D017|nr:alpha/beta fold hydrolase [Methylococcus sp. Mc7]
MSIVVQEVDLFVRDVGAGPPVLFLHGNPDSADIWDEVVARLNGRFRCIAIDLPGFGRSGPAPGFDCSFANLGRFVSVRRCPVLWSQWRTVRWRLVTPRAACNCEVAGCRCPSAWWKAGG